MTSGTRILGDPLFCGAVAALGFLAFLWPFVASPAMRIVAAMVFVFGAWAALITLLAAIAAAERAASPHRRGGEDA